jgi:transposase
LNEPTGVAADAATILFNLPDYHAISTTITAGHRQVIIDTHHPPGCPSCGVIASRRKERRLQRLRDTPVTGPVKVLWSEYRWYCEEAACDRLSFFESTPQVPRRARSTRRLRDELVDTAIRSGRPSRRQLPASPYPGGWSAPLPPKGTCSGCPMCTSTGRGCW